MDNSSMDNYSIRNSNNTYSVSMIIRSSKHKDNCISRSANGIPCMHSALHSSIIAYNQKVKRAKVEYSICKGLYSEKKVFGGNG